MIAYFKCQNVTEKANIINFDLTRYFQSSSNFLSLKHGKIIRFHEN